MLQFCVCVCVRVSIFFRFFSGMFGKWIAMMKGISVPQRESATRIYLLFHTTRWTPVSSPHRGWMIIGNAIGTRTHVPSFSLSLSLRTPTKCAYIILFHRITPPSYHLPPAVPTNAGAQFFFKYLRRSIHLPPTSSIQNCNHHRLTNFLPILPFPSKP